MNRVSIGSDNGLSPIWLVVRQATKDAKHYLWNNAVRNKLQWNFNRNTKLFIHENASENIVCKIAVILSRGRWVNNGLWKPGVMTWKHFLHYYPFVWGKSTSHGGFPSQRASNAKLWCFLRCLPGEAYEQTVRHENFQDFSWFLFFFRA